MQLDALDWVIIGLNFALVLGVGVWVARRAGQDSASYFLCGRSMPWWLLGASMVATTFSTDTPNLVTDLVRQDGVSGNWAWWAFLLTGMVTVFGYARLWRRSGVMTDMEFYELRYEGKAAAFLRGFRALYLGIGFNVIVLSVVCLAAIKIGQIMLGLTPLQTILVASIATAIFSSAGGFLGVLITDLVLFVTAMIGSVLAAYYALSHPDVGGLAGLFANETVREHMDLMPALFVDGEINSNFIRLMFIPLAVQWWSAWYPGAEPGGGGYIAQRMLAAKNENHAMGATLLFNIVHYAVRPWPWIIVALCSLIVYPDLASLKTAFPQVADDKIGHDLAYPAMLTFLPHGVLGLVLASLIAAFMSTVSTHLNWGASYLVHDAYARFVAPNASEKEKVWVGRLVTVITMVLAATLALFLTNAKQVFDIILMFGAGSGSIFLLRWYWWRINAPAELAAMLGSGIIALSMAFTPLGEMIPDPWDFPVAVLGTNLIWIAVMFATAPTSHARLVSFCRQMNPSGPGWNSIRKELSAEDEALVPTESMGGALMAIFLATTLTYSALFGVGWYLYGEGTSSWIALLVFAGCAITLWRVLPKLIGATKSV